MLNLSECFHSSNHPCFITVLDLNEQEKNLLKEARRSIRNELRYFLPQTLEGKNLYSCPPPKFFTQGSWTYGTLNKPAFVPPQQADMDDGCYLPLEFLSETKRPRHAANIFFEAVEQVLSSLCNKHNWHLDTSKPTCVRVSLNESAHIDVPLYAIPLNLLDKVILEARNRNIAMDSSITKQSWAQLPKESILLAHRQNGWKTSDPIEIKNWVETVSIVNGKQFVRVIRYLKAFRDNNWKRGGPASILLMVLAAQCFECRKNRDDLSLLYVVSEIPKILQKDVFNPVDLSENLSERLGKEGVNETIDKFTAFYDNLYDAINTTNREIAQEKLSLCFGSRFNQLFQYIKPSSMLDNIRGTPSIIGPSEIVGRTKAG